MKMKQQEQFPQHSRLSPNDIADICNELHVTTDHPGTAAQHFVIDENGTHTFVPVWKEVPVADGTAQIPVRERIRTLLAEKEKRDTGTYL